MTKWGPFPLRPDGQPWPGLNTRGGRLDPGAGFLEDGSVNAIINEGDILQKRKGLIRGMNERFTGVVCGLFRYTDNCGVEYVVVSDQDGIKVRQPFDIPSFLGSDSFPIDDFETLDTTRWNNADDYRVSLGELLLDLLATENASSFVPESRLMQWFKPSVLSSYYVEIQYGLVAGGTGQIASVVIKRTGSSFLQANVELTASGTYSATIQYVQSGVRSTLATETLSGSSLADGFLRLSYDATTFTVTMRVIPSGGSIVTKSVKLTELQNDALGQNSAIGLSFQATPQPLNAIKSVVGGSI